MAADSKGHVLFTQEAVRRHLDELIASWRSIRRANHELAEAAPYYIDAYQCVRVNLFGEKLTLPTPEELKLPDDLKAVPDDLGEPPAETHPLIDDLDHARVLHDAGFEEEALDAAEARLIGTSTGRWSSAEVGCGKCLVAGCIYCFPPGSSS